MRRRAREVCAVGLVTLAGAFGGVSSAAADHAGDVDCGDFDWYEDALDHLQRHPGDPDRLDRDGDGRACETLPRRGGAPAPTLPSPPPPVGDVFRDVLPGATHTAAIESMAAADVISGFPDGTFRPEAAVTRGQMASLLRRALGFPEGSATFSDTGGSTHRAAIAALADAGVIQGYADGSFRPDARITRGQMATMLVRAFDLPRDTAPGSAFRDVAGTTHESAIDTLAGTSPQPIATGFADGTFRPDARLRAGRRRPSCPARSRTRPAGAPRRGPSPGSSTATRSTRGRLRASWSGSGSSGSTPRSTTSAGSPRPRRPCAG